MPSTGRLRYLDIPAKPGPRGQSAGTLLLIHGFPLSARMWEPQFALAAEGWRIIAPHLRGFDGGADDHPAASVDDYVGDIVDLLDTLHIHDAVVGGLSMGGYVAFALWRLAPTYIRGLVLADTKSQADTPEGVEGRKRMLALVREKGVSAVADEMLPKLIGESTRRDNPAIVDTVRAMILGNSTDAIAGAITAMMTRPDATPLLSTIRVPTLVLVGEEDTLTPPAMSESINKAVSDTELVLISKAGHMSNLEQPEAFNGALARFLSRRV